MAMSQCASLAELSATFVVILAVWMREVVSDESVFGPTGADKVNAGESVGDQGKWLEECDHCDGPLFPGNMDQCFFKNGVQYQPDMSPPTKQSSIEACQKACRYTSGCKYFTYFDRLPGNPTKGDCHLGASNAQASQPTLVPGMELGVVSGPGTWPDYCFEARRLVRSLTTFGAPAVAHPALALPGNQCIPGYRVFTEDLRTPGGGFGKEEDAAAMFTTFPHPKIATVILHKLPDKSWFFPCPNAKVVSWPQMGGAVYQDWFLHDVGAVYNQRLDTNTPPEVGTERMEFSGDLLLKMQDFAKSWWQETLEQVQNKVGEIPNWNLVGYAEAGPSNEMVLVLQHDNLECAISFEGSHSLKDLNRFSLPWGETFCGFQNTHGGMKAAILDIVHDNRFQQQIKPVLKKCKAVNCVGHSMGGSICDLFTACANSGRQWDADYKSIAWIPAETPVKMDMAGTARLWEASLVSVGGSSKGTRVSSIFGGAFLLLSGAIAGLAWKRRVRYSPLFTNEVVKRDEAMLSCEGYA